MTGWPALLDAIDEGLTSRPPVLVDFAPADYGPLPDSLADRATRTLRRMSEVAAALKCEQTELARELAALSTARASAAVNPVRPVPHFLDTKA
jgi:hypothetical protein